MAGLDAGVPPGCGRAAAGPERGLAVARAGAGWAGPGPSPGCAAGGSGSASPAAPGAWRREFESMVSVFFQLCKQSVLITDD